MPEPSADERAAVARMVAELVAWLRQHERTRLAELAHGRNAPPRQWRQLTAEQLAALYARDKLKGPQRQ